MYDHLLFKREKAKQRSMLLRLEPSLVLESNVFHSTGISENPKTADKMLWLDMEKIRKSVKTCIFTRKSLKISFLFLDIQEEKKNPFSSESKHII